MIYLWPRVEICSLMKYEIIIQKMLDIFAL